MVARREGFQYIVDTNATRRVSIFRTRTVLHPAKYQFPLREARDLARKRALLPPVSMTELGNNEEVDDELKEMIEAPDGEGEAKELEDEEGIIDSDDEGAIHSKHREKQIIGLLDERAEPEPVVFETGEKRYCVLDGQLYTVKQLKESLRGLSTDEVTLSLWTSFSTPAAARVDAETGKLS